MNILFLFSFVFSVVMAGEVPIPNDEIIKQIYTSSNKLWTIYPSGYHSGKEDCNKLNTTYKDGGFKCSLLDSNNSPTGINIPSNLEKILSFIRFDVDSDGKSIGRKIDSWSCSYPIKIVKKQDGNGTSTLDISKLESATVSKINNHDISKNNVVDEKGEDKVRDELWGRYKKFFSVYKCKPNTGKMDVNNTVGKSIFGAAFYEKEEDLKKAFIDYISNTYSDIKNSNDPHSAFISAWYKNSRLNYFYTDVLTLSWNCQNAPTTSYVCPPLQLGASFSNNKWTLSKNFWTLAKENKNNVASLTCIEKALGFGNLVVSSIKIKTSSSSLSNTDGLCAKDFIGLSKKRAESMRNIIKTAFNEKGYQGSLEDNVFTLDFYGANRDGTSGPCAHVVVDGTMKDDLVTNLEDLKPYRSAEITIHFRKIPNDQVNKDNKLPNAGNNYFGDAGLRARVIDFSCITPEGVSTGPVPSTIFD